MPRPRRRSTALAEPTEAAPEPAPPPRGHNLRAPDTGILSAEEWQAWMDHRFEGVLQRATALTVRAKRGLLLYPLRSAGSGRAPAGIEKWSDAIQGNFADIRSQLASVLKTAEAIHVQEKEPILTGQRVVDGKLRAFRGPLDDLIKKIRDITTMYATEKVRVEAEQRRMVAEQAEKDAEAARARAIETDDTEALDDAIGAAEASEEANAAASERLTGKVTGAQGATTSLRDNWAWDPAESNLLQLVQAVATGKEPITYLDFNNTALNYAIKREKVRLIAGVKIVNNRST
jgi:hypothetical protein